MDQEPRADDFALHAWVDESMRAARDGREGLYLLAAVVADPSACDAMRETLRALLLRGAQRLHWRDETVDRRLKIASAIGAQDVALVVVVGAPIDHRRQERARAICMERLLYELDQVGVRQVFLESRHDALNTRDIRLVDALRIRGSISRTIVVNFALPKLEPMLWAPDAVAGAVSSARFGHDADVADELGVVNVIDVRLA
ncbi:hypothetical protein [Promicromonospora sp. NPDC023805]|uniref:hypothetical protein n=1 Tax=Promicromonospora sp. NPDC023805 TaxID=3154696 RepID=UPI0033FC4C2F